MAYLASAAAAVIFLNAHGGDAELSIVVDATLVIWAVVSALLGWRTGQPSFALLALLVIPFAIPFGYPDHRYSEGYPVWFSAALFGVVSAAVIVVTAFTKRSGEADRRKGISS